MLEPSSPRKFRLFAILAAAALIVLGILFYQSLSGKTTIPDVTFTNLKGEKSVPKACVAKSSWSISGQPRVRRASLKCPR